MHRVSTMAVLALLLAPGAAAVPHEDEVPAWRDRTWSATTDVLSRSFEHVRTAPSDDGEDRLAWRLDLDTMALTAGHTAPDSNETALLTFHIQRFVEFQDLDGDGRYSLGDHLVEAHDVDGILVRIEEEDDGSLTVRADARILGAGAARLDWTFFLPKGPLNMSQTILSWDFAVRDYPFDTDNQTHLAMLVRMGDTRLAGARTLQSVAGGLVSHITWGTPFPQEAGSTFETYVASGGREVLLALSLPREEDFEIAVQHDVHKARQVGVAEQVARTILGSFWLFTGTLVATVLVLYGAYRWSMRRQGEGG